MRFSHCEQANFTFSDKYILYMAFSKNNFNDHDNIFQNKMPIVSLGS